MNDLCTLYFDPLAVKMEEFTFQNHFKSTRKEEQQILDRNTLPTALQDVYRSGFQYCKSSQ